jgi:hypothetical protein
VEYAPCHNPEVVIAVLWESAEHGMLSAPIARDVMAAWFDKKQRLAEAESARQKLNPATSLVSAILPTLKEPSQAAGNAGPPPAEGTH